MYTRSHIYVYTFVKMRWDGDRSVWITLLLTPRSDGSRCPVSPVSARRGQWRASVSDNSLAWPALALTRTDRWGTRPAGHYGHFREIYIFCFYWDLCSLFELETSRGRLSRKCLSWWESALIKLQSSCLTFWQENTCCREKLTRDFPHVLSVKFLKH